ncbi:HAMP domain-containing histidine kinase [Actinomadura sp. KC345]|uniref:sensor histidine kinase n=1 Tax=Actinomadura sp. KC345 TaxID=2530371 RepID=UPI0010498E1E|nr:HAMP domain-containing sensor histidine kinase [Actinomadura sp. KC345]TDC41964.1 HAMP domain-containing histidine kinase [Actinomadura sp. KC345]
MSLRRRLVLTQLALLALGLLIAGGSGFAALFDWKSEGEHRRMTAVGREAAALVGERAANGGGRGELRLPPETADLARLWGAAAEDGGLPAFIQVRRPDGAVVQTVSLQSGPLGGGPPLPGDLRPGRVTGGNPDGERFVRTRDRTRVDEGPFGRDGTGWLVRTAWVPGERAVLVTAMRTGEEDDLLGRTVGTQVAVTAAALLGLGLLAWRSVRRATRPLEEIAATAARIGAGDLARRLAVPRPKTEAGRLAAALNAMLGQIEAAFREREESRDRLRRFVADASHELRTPVATVRGYAELFRRGAADRPEDLAKAMSRIESETERMGRLVDEMLLLARLDQGRPLEREPVDLAALAAEAAGDAAVAGPDHPLTLEADGPVVVSGDAERLRQILDNLLANVRRHTPPGTAAAVRVAARGGEAVLEVRDEGPGLAADDRARVFERFYRADPSRSRDRGGSGLGLPIVAAVAEAHGGRASVAEAPGGGTVFTVTLPR